MIKMNEQLLENNTKMLEKFDSKFQEISERWDTKIEENNSNMVKRVDT